MMRRLYVHNFRCLENFELSAKGRTSLLLIGPNGAGKSTVGFALELFQHIARGVNRVGDLMKPRDRRHGDAPTRFEIELEIESQVFCYWLALELPDRFRELRVLEEGLTVDGSPAYTRNLADVRIGNRGGDTNSSFQLDWHLVALPIVHHASEQDPIFAFRERLANMLVLRPAPESISGESHAETLRPNARVTDLGAWFYGLNASFPSSYSKIVEHLREVMPDLSSIRNLPTGRDSRSLEFEFRRQNASKIIPFEDLSDGEKCFAISALVLATQSEMGPLICFWDEPDNYLAPSEVGHTIMALRRAFLDAGLFIATSHNPEAIRRFSDENTIYLDRKSHLEPTTARPLDELRANGDLQRNLVEALVLGDLRP